jgi:hypothetical protein
MKDINYPLRKAYKTALDAVGLPVFYQSIPNNINPANYLVFRSINSNDASTKTSADTSTTITVEIHTLKDIMNPGLDADTIAGQVYTYIYAISNFVLPMDQMQMVSTEFSNDTVQNIQLNNQQSYVSRFITFRHNIFVSNASGGGTVITPIGEIDNVTYSTVEGELSAIIYKDGLPLTNKKILLFTKDGITFTQVASSPAGKQYTYDINTGLFTWQIPAEADEEIYIVYQNL